MSEVPNPRRRVLHCLLLGTAGAALAGCGRSSEPAPSAAPSAAPPAQAPPSAAAPTAAPAAAPAGATPGAPLPLLSPNAPQAMALGYHADASTVDAAKHRAFRPGQHCASCIQYQGPATAEQAPCAIFPGHAVPAEAWCQVWAARPA